VAEAAGKGEKIFWQFIARFARNKLLFSLGVGKWRFDKL
jgi:hypothetical protein